jgi:hypothetical protein
LVVFEVDEQSVALDVAVGTRLPCSWQGVVMLAVVDELVRLDVQQVVVHTRNVLHNLSFHVVYGKQVLADSVVHRDVVAPDAHSARAMVDARPGACFAAADPVVLGLVADLVTVATVVVLNSGGGVVPSDP